jgi:hypothetical protein
MSLKRTLLTGVGAGFAGTVAMTVAQRGEMRLTGRQGSTIPGQVAAKLSGGDPSPTGPTVARLNPLMHWAHGIALGPVRGLLAHTGLSPFAASVAFVPMVWGGDAALYKGLGLAPWPWQWTRSEIATDLFGKTVLACATSLSYIALQQR